MFNMRCCKTVMLYRLMHTHTQKKNPAILFFKSMKYFHTLFFKTMKGLPKF